MQIGTFVAPRIRAVHATAPLGEATITNARRAHQAHKQTMTSGTPQRRPTPRSGLS